MSRYSELAPFTIQEQEDFAMLAIYFFSPLNNEKLRKELNLPVKDHSTIPLSVLDFFNWYGQNGGGDLFKKRQRICEFFNMLCGKNFLSNLGIRGNGAGILFRECYYFMLELTEIEKKGHLFLGKYLGLEFIANKIKQNLVHITGKIKHDLHAGSGILITSQVILTCGHVLSDMKVDDHVKISGIKYKIKTQAVHPDVDFGVIILESPVEPFCKDIALRSSTILEKIIIAGFPKIPSKLNDCPIMQSGEIAGRIESSLHNGPLELFTAISRPGNSGGPVISSDGKLLGIVTGNLERKQEVVDGDQSMLPCFAAIPSDVILKSFSELEVSKKYSIPWEDYQ